LSQDISKKNKKEEEDKFYEEFEQEIAQPERGVKEQ